MDNAYDYIDDGGGGGAASWTEWASSSTMLTRILGISMFASFFQNSSVVNSAKLLILGSLIEAGRKFAQWIYERMRFQYSITAQFDEGDPTYDWIVLFLTQEKVWMRSREFRVTAKSSKRQWSVSPGPEAQPGGSAEYVPTFQLPQLFQWKGHWIEIKRNKGSPMLTAMGTYSSSSTLYLTIYTRHMDVISTLVEEARKLYIENSRPNVIIHTADSTHYGPGFAWNNVKRKARRPLSSIVLQEGVLDSLVNDAQEFLDMEDWYIKAGIPHRRGYLLHGPPGTGKSSTIYALAGELGLEIYSLSLASGFVDDSFLQRAASSIPKKAIFLIEDIDCAFSSREDSDDEPNHMIEGYPGMVTPMMMQTRRKSAVTLSGLLNVIDGVGSEEGKLFFATTNYIDHLDAALVRPGRIDKKVQYQLATRKQAEALFIRFFPESHLVNDGLSNSEKTSMLKQLAATFASGVPEHEFSTADLQGYLLSCKKEPERAANGISKWVNQERDEKEERLERELVRKEKARKAKDRREANQLQGLATRLGVYSPMGQVNGGMVGGPLSPLSAVSVQAQPLSQPSLLSAPVPVVNGNKLINGTPPEDHDNSRSDSES